MTSDLNLNGLPARPAFNGCGHSGWGAGNAEIDKRPDAAIHRGARFVRGRGGCDDRRRRTRRSGRSERVCRRAGAACQPWLRGAAGGRRLLRRARASDRAGADLLLLLRHRPDGWCRAISRRRRNIAAAKGAQIREGPASRRPFSFPRKDRGGPAIEQIGSGSYRGTCDSSSIRIRPATTRPQ